MICSNIVLHKSTLCLSVIDGTLCIGMITLLLFRLVNSLVHQVYLSVGMYIGCAVVLTHFIFQLGIAMYLRHVAKKNDYYGVRRWLKVVAVIFITLVCLDISQIIGMESFKSQRKVVVIALSCIFAIRVYSVIEWTIVFLYMRSIANTKKCPIHREQYNNQV